MVITQMIADLTKTEEVKLLIRDQHPVTAKYRLQDAHSEMAYDVVVRCRRMGEDNGKDQLVNVTDFMQSTIAQMRQTARKLTPAEVARLPKRR